MVCAAYITIMFFSLPSDGVIDNSVVMSEHAIQHFKHIFSLDVVVPSPVSLEWIQNLLSFWCSSQVKDSMTIKPSHDEIIKVL